MLTTRSLICRLSSLDWHFCMFGRAWTNEVEKIQTTKSMRLQMRFYRSRPAPAEIVFMGCSTAKASSASNPELGAQGVSTRPPCTGKTSRAARQAMLEAHPVGSYKNVTAAFPAWSKITLSEDAATESLRAKALDQAGSQYSLDCHTTPDAIEGR